MGHEFTRIVCLYSVEIIGRNSHQAYSFQSSADILGTVQERRIVNNMKYTWCVIEPIEPLSMTSVTTLSGTPAFRSTDKNIRGPDGQHGLWLFAIMGLTAERNRIAWDRQTTDGRTDDRRWCTAHTQRTIRVIVTVVILLTLWRPLLPLWAQL